ncbi:MAG: DUF6029 family protein [Bacteroidales bacterium]|nr:DUF6029 family protein [Bacteroidales bacterium]
MRLICWVLLFSAFFYQLIAQQDWQINGDVQLDAQYYLEDSTAGAPAVKEHLLSNGYFNLSVRRGGISMGIRYENFANPMLGFDPRLKGSGFPHRYIEYQHSYFSVCAGSFYEQFGSGITLRSYEERTLGFDNAIDGIRLRAQVHPALQIKALIGQQRQFFTRSEGLIRGIDAEFYLNELNDSLRSFPLNIRFGGSAVSRYQVDKDPMYKLPENVLAWSIRNAIGYKNASWSNEFGFKFNDPNATNHYIYKDGMVILSTFTYARKGFGLLLSYKQTDNMDFRSDRTITGLASTINYIPALARIHSYSLTGKYPYTAQPNGEAAVQAQLTFKIPKKSKLGGKYGMDLSIQYVRSQSIDKQPINDSTPLYTSGTDGYVSRFFRLGNETYFEDFDIEIQKKFSSSLKGVFSYVYVVYNSLIAEGHDYGMFYAHATVIDLTWKISSKHALRFEAQHLYKEQYDRNWVAGLIEYSHAKGWFFSISDNFNYQHPDPTKRIHYYSFHLTKNIQATRVSLTYGKTFEGITCVGGVCRYMPATYGILLSFNTSF